jgi:FO synthase subunit 2
MNLTLVEILAKALAGEDLSIEAGVFLLQRNQPEELENIRQAADQLRRSLCGETVTYVVNRNLNFTNICEQHCHFCAFRRDAGAEGAFWLDNAQLQEKAADAFSRGATELCMQGGLNPLAKLNGRSLDYYLDLVRSLKTAFPSLHLHAFSPQEIEFIARQDGLSFADVILALQEAGVNSLPGTAAEVLDDDIRRQICPEKLDTATWLEIVGTAHRLGMMTTSTMLCGHIESPQQQIEHLAQLRSLQQRNIQQHYPARISEFILLPFVGQEAPAVLRKKVGRDQPDLAKTLHLTAVSRLFLGKWIPNHQPSWVKLGLAGATEALRWGCNDLGGTLMEEHITTMAGAQGGTCLTVEQLREAIATTDRPAAERSTLYEKLNQPVDALPLMII